MQYATIMYCPSMIAASAVYAARSALNKTPVWNETLKLHTGFSEPQVLDCARLLATLHSNAAKSKLRAVYRKYASSERGAVSFLQPAKSLLPADSVSVWECKEESLWKYMREQKRGFKLAALWYVCLFMFDLFGWIRTNNLLFWQIVISFVKDYDGKTFP